MLFASMPDLFMPFVVALQAYPQPLPKGRREKQPTSDSSLKGREENCKSFARVWGAHTADSTQYDILKANAIANRKSPTEAEEVLWSMLKGNNLGLHFRRQHVILDYIVDFICLDKGLVIELDGGYHEESQQKEYDEQRTAHLQQLGYTELRFTNEELLVNPDGVIAKIKAVAEKLPSFKGRIEDRPILRAVCVGYVTKEKSRVKQFFTRRAIINGGPVCADDCTDEEVQFLMEAVRKGLMNEPLRSMSRKRSLLNDGPIYIETRNFNDYSKWKEAFERAGFEYKKHLNFHIDCSDKEAMWERLSETRKRQVRKAIKSGVTIKSEGVSELEIRDFYRILSDLYRTKVKTPLFPEAFFLDAHRQGIAKYLLIKHEGKVIGGMMIVSSSNCVYEWYICGLDAEYKDQYPSVMATWAAMEYANRHGLARFDVMGAGEPDVPYGVRDFKAEFGGKLVEHGRFLYVNKPLLYRFGVWGVHMLKHIQ